MERRSAQNRAQFQVLPSVNQQDRRHLGWDGRFPQRILLTRWTDFAASRVALSPHPEKHRATMRLEGWPRSGPHGSPGDAKHRPETALTRLLTMRTGAPSKRLAGAFFQQGPGLIAEF